MRVRRLSYFAIAVVLLMTTGITSLASAESAVTVNGVVLGFNDKPVVGWPIVITPLIPSEMNADKTNAFYKIPNYNEHPVFTDESGRFTMTDVTDYPQVQHHKYRIWSTGDSTEELRIKSNPFIRTMETIDLSKASNGQIFVVIKGEPGAALKVLAKNPDGTPFNGRLGIGVISGAHSHVKSITFKDGIGISTAIPVGNMQVPGRVLILPASMANESAASILAKGKDFSIETMKEDGVLLDKRVKFAPFQWATAELIVPE